MNYALCIMNYKYGPFLRFGRIVLRLGLKRLRIKGRENIVKPAIYIVHHQRFRGTLSVLAWFDIPVHVWMLAVLCDKDTCYSHGMDYTFTRRYHFPRWLAVIPSYLQAVVLAAVAKSGEFIPVYRKSERVMETFGISIEYLLKGENILIAPDKDYRSKSKETGEIYSGFLVLEEKYYRQTGEHLAFIPLHIDSKAGDLIVFEPIYFRDGEDFDKEKEIVKNGIVACLNG